MNDPVGEPASNAELTESTSVNSVPANTVEYGPESASIVVSDPSQAQLHAAPRARFQVLSNLRGNTMSKTWTRGSDGSPKKILGGVFSIGYTYTREANIDEYIRIAQQLVPSQFIVSSNANIGERVETTSQARSDGEYLTRTKDHMPYVPGAPAFVTNDFDYAEENPHQLGPHELMALYQQQFPEAFTGAGWGSYPSSGSFIYDSWMSCWVTERRGYHLAFIVKDGGDVARFKTVLFKRLWLLGYGYIKVSRDGSKLVRTLFDEATLQSHQPIFTNADCLHGLEQRKPDDEILVVPGAMVDTSLVRDLTPAEEAEYQRLVADAKAVVEDHAAGVRVAYIESEAGKYAAARAQRGETVTPEVARRVVSERRSGGRLDPEDLLYFQSGEAVSVKEVLERGIEFDGQTLADPIEPDYHGGTTTVAKLFWNEGRNPLIHSFAHGGRSFFLRPKIGSAVAFADIEITYEQVMACNPAADDGLVNAYREQERRKFNDKHGALMIEGKAVVVYREKNENLDAVETKFATYGSISQHHQNRKLPRVDGASDSERRIVWDMKVFDDWRERHDRRTYTQPVFAPDPDLLASSEMPKSGAAYNLYIGANFEPKRGSCQRILNHIFSVWCRNNEESYWYVIRWLARMVQQPGKAGYTVIVLRSREGGGKNIILDIFDDYYGSNSVMLTNPEDLTGFNDHLATSVFVFLNEALWGGNRSVEGAVKSTITDKKLLVERKYIPKFKARNCTHIMVASNNDWAVPVGISDRRFFILDLDETRTDDSDYFGPLVEEIKNGGKE